jgi:hypothetical protein
VLINKYQELVRLGPDFIILIVTHNNSKEKAVIIRQPVFYRYFLRKKRKPLRSFLLSFKIKSLMPYALSLKPTNVDNYSPPNFSDKVHE